MACLAEGIFPLRSVLLWFGSAHFLTPAVT